MHCLIVTRYSTELWIPLRSTNQRTRTIFWPLQFCLYLTEWGRALATIKMLSKLTFSYNLHLAASNCKEIIVFNTPKNSAVSENNYPHRWKDIFLLMVRKTLTEAKLGISFYFSIICDLRRKFLIALLFFCWSYWMQVHMKMFFLNNNFVHRGSVYC